MPPFLFPLLLLLPLISATDQLPPCPAAASCGNLTNISYPFWVYTHSLPPYFCGYQTFAIRCHNNTPFLSLPNSDNQLAVTNIDYASRTLSLFDPTSSSTPCPILPQNTPLFFLSQISITPTDTIITFFYNCTRLPLNASANGGRVSCLRSYLFIGLYDIEVGSPCTNVVPMLVNKDLVDYIVTADSLDMGKVLREGFQLQWLEEGPGECGNCERSGGRCGNQQLGDGARGEMLFRCYCGEVDGWRDRVCGNKKNNMGIIIGVSIAAGILLVSILCFIGLWRLLRRHQKQRQYASSSLLSYDSSITGLPFSDKATDLTEFQCQTQMFTYEELHEATNSFDTAMEIGDGGFGAVYKGNSSSSLPFQSTVAYSSSTAGTLRDGRTVAVKRLYDSNFKGAKQFVNEIMILSRLRHQNLVTLYGCTSPRSPQLLLVYELVPNGTVADHLHGHRADEDLLTWPRRLSVAVETASALGYLHAVDPPIIHRDIKTGNILLDAEFHVKVADFGLSRFIPGDGATHISTAPQGTPGYLDPEYHWSYQLTDRSDVYSFGVVLAELLSSKPAVDLSRERTEINLSTLAMNRIQSGNFDDLVDRKLGYDSDAETRRKMRLVAELAFRCLQTDREMRPAIKEVLEVLIGLQNGASLDGSGEVEHYVEQVVGGDLGLEKVVKDRPVSPDTVTQKWVSVSSTPTSSH